MAFRPRTDVRNPSTPSVCLATTNSEPIAPMLRSAGVAGTPSTRGHRPHQVGDVRDATDLAALRVICAGVALAR